MIDRVAALGRADVHPMRLAGPRAIRRPRTTAFESARWTALRRAEIADEPSHGSGGPTDREPARGPVATTIYPRLRDDGRCHDRRCRCLALRQCSKRETARCVADGVSRSGQCACVGKASARSPNFGEPSCLVTAAKPSRLPILLRSTKEIARRSLRQPASSHAGRGSSSGSLRPLSRAVGSSRPIPWITLSRSTFLPYARPKEPPWTLPHSSSRI
jgi:hypothetical protein